MRDWSGLHNEELLNKERKETLCEEKNDIILDEIY